MFVRIASGSRKRYTASQVRQMLLDSDVDDSDGSDILIEIIIHFCKTLTFAGDYGLFTRIRQIPWLSVSPAMFWMWEMPVTLVIETNYHGNDYIQNLMLGLLNNNYVNSQLSKV